MSGCECVQEQSPEQISVVVIVVVVSVCVRIGRRHMVVSFAGLLFVVDIAYLTVQCYCRGALYWPVFACFYIFFTYVLVSVRVCFSKRVPKKGQLGPLRRALV